MLEEPTEICPQRDTTPNQGKIRISIPYPPNGSTHAPIFDIIGYASSTEYPLARLNVFVDDDLVLSQELGNSKSAQILATVKLTADIKV